MKCIFTDESGVRCERDALAEHLYCSQHPPAPSGGSGWGQTNSSSWFNQARTYTTTLNFDDPMKPRKK